jgi:hypothetical protein
MSSDLRAALETSFDEIEKEETVAVEPVVSSEPSAVPAEPEQQSDPVAAPENTVSDPVAVAPPSDEKGSETPSDLKPIDEVISPDSEIPEINERKLESRVDTPPVSWKGEAKKVWTDLPVHVRQEVMRREMQTERILRDSSLDRRKVQEITQVLTPHMDRIAANYQGNPLMAINNLLETERVLNVGTPMNKAQMVADIIKQFNIDIGTLDSLLAGSPVSEQVRQQSDVEKLLDQRLAPVMSYFQQQQAERQRIIQESEQRVVQTVEQMAVDHVNYPYFSEVREDMADIIEMGAKRNIDVSLQEAYNRAVRMNGHTAQAVETRQSTQAATQAALQAHQEAQKAKGAAVSVSGSPSTTSGPTVDPSNLRSLISSQLDGRSDRL